MTWLSDGVRELIALFVDDVRFTLAVVVWLAVAAAGLPRVPIAGQYDSLVLFAGCAVALVWSVRRQALAVSRR